MTRYFISFPDGAMDHIPEDDMGQVGRDAHAVMTAAKAAGAWVTGGGILGHDGRVVGTDGSIADIPYAAVGSHLGGFSIVRVGSLDDALGWAGRFAVACRCPQEVRELMDDPEA